MKREIDTTYAARPKQGSASVGHPVDVATGRLFDDVVDFVVPGRSLLAFARHYSSDLASRPGGILGIGWRTPFEARIRRDVDGFRLLDQDGETEILFDDRENALDRGEPIVNLGQFSELSKSKDGLIVVTKWTAEPDSISRMTFRDPSLGRWAEVESIEDASGDGCDVQRDEHNRVKRIVQRRESRFFELKYDASDRVRTVTLHYASIDSDSRDGKRRTKPSSEEVLSFEYSTTGCLTKVSDCAGRSRTYTYDDENFLTQEVNICGIEYFFRYDRQRRCVETTGSDGYAKTTLSFDESGRVTWVRNAEDEQTAYFLNERGQVERIVDPLGNETSTVYDEHGRSQVAVDALGNETKFEYDKAGNRSAIVNAVGERTCFEYTATHQLATVIDAKGNRWRRKFDSANRVVEFENPDEKKLCLTRNRLGDITSMTDALGNESIFEWDELGNMTSVVDPLGNSTRYEYTGKGHVTESISAVNGKTKATLDVLGRPISIRKPDGSKLDFRWNAFGQITQLTNEDGDSTIWKYQSCGLPSQISRPLGGKIGFRWSKVPGRLLEIENERRESFSFEYDLAGRVVAETDFSGRRTSYELDAAGFRTKAVGADGRATHIARDALGRTSKIEFEDGRCSDFMYDKTGLLVRAVNESADLEFVYDAVGRLTCEKQNGIEIHSSYDAAGNRSRRSSDLTGSTNFEWDGNHNLARLTNENWASICFAYEESQQECLRQIGNALRIRQEFDQLGRKTVQFASRSTQESKRKDSSSDDIVKREYKYSNAGRLLKVYDSRCGTTEYGYDRLGRLTSTEFVGEKKEEFVFDKTDNIVERRMHRFNTNGSQSSLLESREYAKGDILVATSTAEYEHNAAGRMTRKTEVDNRECAFRWNDSGQIIEFVSPDGDVWRYEYDALGRRIRKSGPNSTTKFVWDGKTILGEIDTDAGGVETVTGWEFEPQSYAPILKTDTNGTYYFINDVAGQPRELVNLAGDVVCGMRPDSWGAVDRAEPSQVSCPIRFQGQWHDKESGLHYNRFRYYDPSLAKYLSPDPLGIEAGIRPTHYVADPNRWIDPLGLIAEYSDLDSLGRPTGAFADLTSSDLRPTDTSPARVDPPGWIGGAHPHHQNRSHLIADTLGGSGTDPRNIVALTDGTNHPGMSVIEGQLRRHLRAGNRVLLEVRPVYDGDSLTPRSVKIYAVDQNMKVVVDEEVMNGRRQNTKCC